MNTLSFDIGIKNLSYCVMDKSGVIIAWDLINIIGRNDVVCGKEGCERNSTFILNGNSFPNECFCGLHCRAKGLKKAKIKQPKHKGINNQDLIEKLFGSLESHLGVFNDTGVKKILLELQPSLNPKMKFISHCLFSFLLMKMDKSTTIRFCSARHKLSGYYKVNSRGKNTKSQRKTDSIKYTMEILENENQVDFLKLFMESKKKDDLADCFLQARHFVK